jgi:type VI secretion system secreted protein Hcp
MADNVHLKLTLEKQGEVKGESSVETLNRKDTIECMFFQHKVKTAREANTNIMLGRRQYEPIVVRKEIDKASPMLLQALTTNEKVKEATFLFFRPNKTGDGTSEQFYTITLKNGNIAGVYQCNPDTKDGSDVHMKPYEEVEFVFQDIEWRHETGKTSAADSWSQGK